MVTTLEKPTDQEIEDELLHQEAVGDQPAELTAAQRIEHEHYEEIKELNSKVCAARSSWTTAKDRAGALKKEYDALNGELLDLIRGGPDPQQRLALKDGEPATEEQPPNWSDEWRKVTVEHLDIAVGLVNLLTDNGLGTLGDLDDYWKSQKQLTDIKGIGEGKAAAVADAFANYGTAHPELWGEQAAQPANQPVAADAATDGPVDDDDEDDYDDEEEENWDGDDL